MAGTTPGHTARGAVLQTGQQPPVNALDFPTVLRHRGVVLTHPEESTHAPSRSRLRIVGLDGATDELETIDEFSCVLEDGFWRSVGLCQSELAPRLVPLSSASPHSVNAMMQFNGNGHRVVVNLDALSLEPRSQNGILGKDMVLLPTPWRELV